MTREIKVECIVNGKEVSKIVPASLTLAAFLRETLGLTGTKISCNSGKCGSCTVLIDGKPAYSCITLVPQVHGHTVTTIEGISKDGELTDLQQAFIDEGAVQCGFCTPGMVISGEYLLAKNPSPTEEEIRQAIAGNLCRCTGYVKIIKAVQKAAEKRQD
jgi:carbon-monoxide dehydrogenase small subunit